MSFTKFGAKSLRERLFYNTPRNPSKSRASPEFACKTHRQQNQRDRSFRLQCPLMAQSRHLQLHRTCPLSGVKQTWLFAVRMSAFDPKRTCVVALHV